MTFRGLNKETITFRLTVKYTLFIFITLVILSATTLFSVQYYIYSQSNQQVKNISHILLEKVSANGEITNADLEDISQMNENIDINIRKNNQMVFETSENYNLMVPLTQNKTSKTYELGEYNLMYYNSEFTNAKNDVFVIQVLKDMNSEREFIKVLFWILLLLNGFAFCVSIILGYLMSKRALKPIENIVNQAKEITVSDLSKRIVINGPDDELKHLSETFNDLISRIEIGYEKQNRFTMDASHELATPLAVIKGYLDIVGRWGKHDPAVLDEAIDMMKKETKNMTELLDALLAVSKSDNNQSLLNLSEFWLNELLVEIYKEEKILYPDYEFIIENNQSISIYADRPRIKQAIRAIINNSVKYSRPGSLIQISGIQNAAEANIIIQDTGHGIPEPEIAYIFDRFYRVDKARSREIRGAGLGLSIVKEIIEMHSGRIDVESIVDKGTCITLNLPLKFTLNK